MVFPWGSTGEEARTVARVKRSNELASIESRRRLRIRPEPYFFVIEKGLALGYRRSSQGGAWIVRRYDPVTRRNAETRLANADDNREADGVEVLTFAQAQRLVLADAKHQAEAVSGKHYTVADAAADYVSYLRDHGKAPGDTAQKLKSFVLESPLASKRLSELTPSDFDAWTAWAMKRAPKRKPKKDKPKPKPRAFKKPRPAKQKASKPAPPPLTPNEARRRRRSTVNRYITSLKAALNHAQSRGKVSSGEAWSKLQKFKRVDGANLRWLQEDEAKRLVNAADVSLRKFVQGALMSGAAPGELARAQARDFDEHSETLLVSDSKTRPPRRIPLTKEGVALFQSLVAGLKSHDPIFTRADGTPWYKTAWVRAIQEASDAGSVSPRATFYSLRHTYASHLAQQGVPLMFIASALGHKDTRMVEKHYAHLAPSHVADTIRANLPSFGIAADTKVKALKPK